jgi:hypothetical protein
MLVQFLEKVQRQNRAAEEVKMALRPFYTSRKIDKNAYKDILGKCVPKVRSLQTAFLDFIQRSSQNSFRNILFVIGGNEKSANLPYKCFILG